MTRAQDRSDREELVNTVVNTNQLTDEERGEWLRRSAGGWANDDPEGLEEYLKWNRAQRKLSRDTEVTCNGRES